MAKKKSPKLPYPSATEKTRHKPNAAVGGAASGRKHTPSVWSKRVQWQVSGGWYLRVADRIPGREPMAVYIDRYGPVAYQYFLATKTLGVEVLP